MKTFCDKFIYYGELFTGKSPKPLQDGYYFERTNKNLYLFCSNSSILLLQRYNNLFIEVPNRKFLLNTSKTDTEIINTAFDKFLTYEESWVQANLTYRVTYEEYCNLMETLPKVLLPLRDVLFPNMGGDKNDYIWRVTCLSEYTFSEFLLMISNLVKEPSYFIKFSKCITAMIHGRSIHSRYANPL